MCKQCKHVFVYPEDTPENYNPDGETLTGICRLCGGKQKSYGMKWALPYFDRCLYKHPYGESLFEFDRLVKL